MRLATLLCTLLLASQAGAACYKVKPNGKLTTRPAYALQGTTLIKSKVRAPVGALCNPKLSSKPSGRDVYAAWGPAGTVALCSKSK
jgi:hypothetical protein